MADAEAKKSRAYPTVLFYIPGWPSQEPNRKMVWHMHFDGQKAAAGTIKRMSRRFPEVVWCMEMMTAAEATKLRKKPYRHPDLKRGRKTLG